MRTRASKLFKLSPFKIYVIASFKNHMSGNLETDERLRRWLNGNQTNRERMCAELLPLLGEYDQVEPRRPQGGPDGGRDLQARFIPKEKKVFGAVGFKNSVSDSNEETREISSKFVADLKPAKKANEDLWGFVFFTNVDLTPGEEQKLVDLARNYNIAHCKVFYREKLRLALDSGQGIGIRARYLDIELNIEELTAFVSCLGDRHASKLLKLEQTQAEIFCKQRKLQQATSSLQQKISDVVTSLDSGTQKIISTSTGGDSFCYFLPLTTENGATGFYTVIHKGEYPIFEVTCRECDIIRSRERKQQGIPDFMDDPYYTRNIEVGSLAPKMARTISCLPRLHDGGVLKLNLFFFARNGGWNQILRLKRNESGIWHMATQISREGHLL